MVSKCTKKYYTSTFGW